MHFRFKRSDATVEAGFRRIACETLDEALGLLRDRPLTTEQIVHRVRRNCKAMRGLLRLVRPVFKPYDSENGIFRDVAASLSAARDSVVLVEALDSLVADAAKTRSPRAALDCGKVADIRAQLVTPSGDAASVEAQLTKAADMLLAARVRAASWSLADHGDPVLAPGLRKTYRATRRWMVKLDQSDDPQISHEWRKQVKYHWQHMRLLRALAPDLTKSRVRSAGRLGDLLGEQHDLDLLAQTVEAHGAAGQIDKEAAKGVAELAGHRAAQLARRSAKLGGRLFDQKPAAYMQAWDEIWERWPRL